MKSYQEAIFGTFQGQNIVSYTFENDLGYRLKVMTYGATVLEYATPDKNHEFANIVVGFNHFDAYVATALNMVQASDRLQDGLQKHSLS